MVLLAIFLLDASVHAADKIRIGFGPGASNIPFPLAQKKGFLKEEGIYIRANGEATIQFLMEWQKVDREIATATYEYLSKAVNDDGNLPEKGLRLLIDEAKVLLKVEREVPISEVSDLSILREVQKELGIKGP